MNTKLWSVNKKIAALRRMKREVTGVKLYDSGMRIKRNFNV